MTRLELRIVHHVFEKRDIGLDAPDAKLPQRAVHALAGLCEVPSPSRGLHQQRIVVRSDGGAAVRRSTVEADAEAGGRAIGMDLAVVGNEIIGGILGGNAALQRVAIHDDAFLPGQRHRLAVQRVSLRNLNLAPHNVDAGDHLGDGVLHLDAGVDLDEIPLARLSVHQKLHRAGAEITGGAREPDCSGRQFQANGIG